MPHGENQVRLTQLMQEALYEFDNKVDSYECQWKPKTMAKLAELGLTQGVKHCGKVIAYRITPAGRDALNRLKQPVFDVL